MIAKNKMIRTTPAYTVWCIEQQIVAGLAGLVPARLFLVHVRLFCYSSASVGAVFWKFIFHKVV